MGNFFFKFGQNGQIQFLFHLDISCYTAITYQRRFIFGESSLLKDLTCCMHKWTYRKVASSNTSHLEAYAGKYRLLLKGIFDTYVL